MYNKIIDHESEYDDCNIPTFVRLVDIYAIKEFINN